MCLLKELITVVSFLLFQKALVPLKDFLFPNQLLANLWFYMSCCFKSNDHNTVFAFLLFFEYLFSKGDGSPHVPNPGQFGQQLEKKKSKNRLQDFNRTFICMKFKQWSWVVASHRVIPRSNYFFFFPPITNLFKAI